MLLQSGCRPCAKLAPAYQQIRGMTNIESKSAVAMPPACMFHYCHVPCAAAPARFSAGIGIPAPAGGTSALRGGDTEKTFQMQKASVTNVMNRSALVLAEIA